MSVPWPSPPICEDCDMWMVPDHGITLDLKHDGRLLYVCPDCCQSVDRKPTLNGGEPKCGMGPRCTFTNGAEKDGA